MATGMSACGWGISGPNRNSSAHMPLNWPVLYLILALLIQSPLYITGDDEDLRIGFQLLQDEEHLNAHFRPLLKSAGPIGLVDYHILHKPVESQKLHCMLVHRSVSLLQSEKLLFHSLLGRGGKESLVETLRELMR